MLKKQFCKTVQIIVLALSTIFLGTATWITTLTVPNWETKMLDEDSTISKLRYAITTDTIQGLYTTDVQTEARIDLFNIHFEKKMNEMMSTNNAISKLEQGLRKDFFEKVTEQIKQWDSLFVIKYKQQNSTELPKFDACVKSLLRQRC